MLSNKGDTSEMLANARINRINRALSEIYTAFLQAFSDATDKTVDVFNKELFEQIWTKLSIPLNTFQSLEELNKYYLSIANHLNALVEDYAYLADKSISQTKVDMLSQLIQIYYSFSKQSFLLNTLKGFDNPFVFLEEIKSFRNFCEHANQLSYYRSLTISLENTVALLFDEFNQHGFPLPLHYEKLDRQSRVQHILFSSMTELLQSLPSTNELNKAMDNIHEAVQKTDKKAISEDKEKLRQFIKKLQTIKEDIPTIFNKHRPFFENAKKRIPDDIEFLQKKLKEVKDSPTWRIAMALKAMVDKNSEHAFININHTDYPALIIKAKEICQKQVVKPTFVDKLTNKDQSWKAASAKLTEWLSKIASDTDSFLVRYKMLFAEINQYVADVKTLDDSLTAMAEVLLGLEKNLSQLKTMTDTSKEVLTLVQKILESYLNTPDNYLHSFFLHHWWKVLLGGLTSSGPTTLFALLFGLDPISVTVLSVASAAIGAAFGGGTGVGADYFSDLKKNKNEMVDGHSSSKLLEETHKEPKTIAPQKELIEKPVTSNWAGIFHKKQSDDGHHEEVKIKKRVRFNGVT